MADESAREPPFSRMSLFASRLHVHCNDPLHPKVRFPATGCFWRGIDGQLVLLTNLHVVSGWDHVRGEAASKSKLIPIHLDVELRWVLNHSGGEQVKHGTLTLLLRANDGGAIWYIDPAHSTHVDLAAIKLPHEDEIAASLELPPGSWLTNVGLNDVPVFADFDEAAGDDVFLLGFPQGFDGGLGLPIWKRGSVATDPFLDYRDLPAFLVDAASREGMSECPVFARRFGLFERGGTKGVGHSTKLLGIYSGRVGDANVSPDLYGASLGLVWKADRIAQLLDGGKRGAGYWESGGPAGHGK